MIFEIESPITSEVFVHCTVAADFWWEVMTEVWACGAWTQRIWREIGLSLRILKMIPDGMTRLTRKFQWNWLSLSDLQGFSSTCSVPPAISFNITCKSTRGAITEQTTSSPSPLQNLHFSQPCPPVSNSTSTTSAMAWPNLFLDN